MDDERLNRLIKSYTGTKYQIDKLQVIVQVMDEATVRMNELIIAQKKVENFRATLSDISTNIFENCVDVDTITKNADVIEIGILFLDNIQMKVEDLIAKVKIREASISRPMTVKLPIMELPNFDGKYEEWLSFRDLFSAAVIGNTNLTGAQRLQYLKSSLKGEAGNAIRSFAITDENFNEAWKLIEERYDNKREIGYALLKRLFHASELKGESPSNMQGLLDLFSEALRSLKILGRTVDQWDDLIVFLLLQKLDVETRRDWARSLKGTEFPSLKELTEFVQTRIRSHQSATYGGQHKQSTSVQRKVNTVTTPTSELKCLYCGEPHPLFKCQKFVKATPEDRVGVVKKNKLCFNCLSPKHSLIDCKSTFTCQKCGKKHHTLIHLERVHQDFNAFPPPQHASNLHQVGRRTPPLVPVSRIPVQSGTDSGSLLPQRSVMSINRTSTSSRGLMSTAVIWVKNSYGSKSLIRVFLDSGSDSNVIKESTVRALGLSRTNDFAEVYGVGNILVGKSRGTTTLLIGSCYSNFKMEVSCQIMSKISAPQPAQLLNRSQWSHLNGLQLADPTFHQPGEIDVILGNGVFFSVLGKERKIGSPLSPIAVSTSFGWILGGELEFSTSNNYTIRINHAKCDLESSLKRFWELDELPRHEVMSPTERKVEGHFSSTIRRNEAGRFITALPITDNISILGASRSIALKRFHGVERRLKFKPDLKKGYEDFMREYKELGHMIPVKQNEQVEVLGMTNYLPHHFVLKEESTTTRLRVVFDGSAASSSGLSLNNCLMVGPTIQDDLFTLLCRFRLHKIVLKADIVKMYRQFQVRDEDQKKLRILWRESPQEPIEEFQLTTVTYGTASAPHTATRCLKQLADDEEGTFPIGANILRRDFYVDDLLSGAKSITEALSIYRELTLLLESAGLTIRKWDSNSQEVLNKIPLDLREINNRINSDSSATKVLGVHWNSREDCFFFSGPTLNPKKTVTKRIVASDLARVFDPIGWLAPITVTGKLLLQKLWCPILEQDEEVVVGWDDPLPLSIQNQWKAFQDSLVYLNGFKVPRCVISDYRVKEELHGFCDASEKAFAAVVYLRLSGVSCHLLSAKTRIAPVRQISIPRLELCGAVLLAKLMKALVKATGLNCAQYFWTDSEIVLKWIYSSSKRWKTFVANRVSEIQDMSPSESWHYVKSQDNPADCASRGLSASELNQHQLWWSGPDWLHEPTLPSFARPRLPIAPELVEEKPRHVLISAITSQVSLVGRYSNFRTMNRVIAFCLRFFFNTKDHPSKRQLGPLTCVELQRARVVCLKLAQGEAFQSELIQLKEKKQLTHSSSLLSLHPFIDPISGLIRVGGRLQESHLPESTKHQIILPTHHELTKLLVEHFHKSHCHAGFQLLWASIQREYWIPRARNLIKSVLRKCRICTRLRADCKALHLEPVTDLTAEAFLATLKRFVARRGLPSDVYSDCGRNFVRANRELRELSTIPRSPEVANFVADQQITWHFNPPASPHHGGLWEAGVKSVKYHLLRVVGKRVLSIEEFLTVLCQVESALNSRPLCALSNDPSDFNVLTPGHFLIGHPLLAVPEPDVTDQQENKLTRWEKSSQIFQHFWRRWSQEYLVTLQQRSKWKNKTKNMAVGDLVLLRDEQVSPLHWRMGRIMTLHPGKDGLVRVVTVKTATGVLERPIVKLSLLLPSEEA